MGLVGRSENALLVISGTGVFQGKEDARRIYSSNQVNELEKYIREGAATSDHYFDHRTLGYTLSIN